VKVDVNTSVGPDGSVTCDVRADGKKAVVVFTGSDISVSVPSAFGEISFTVPQALAAGALPA
jgi:hypothetical protein